MSKQHFVFLDGLRGVAALSVAVLHAGEFFNISTKYSHAYLAADFFFLLSGFVVAYAYDDRIGQRIGGDQYRIFLWKRFVRLYPMIFFGTLMGFGVSIIGSLQPTHHLNVIATAALLPASLVLAPLGLLFSYDAFPLDNPMWSIFFELIANAVYGAAPKTSFALRWALLAGAALALFAVSYVFGGLQRVGFHNFGSFAAGFVRVAYPFAAGVFIFRLGFHNRSRIPSILAEILVCAALLVVLWMPSISDTRIYDGVAVTAIFPLLILFSIKAAVWAPAAGFWRFIGKLSYPFYIIHVPIIRIIYQIYHHFPIFRLYNLTAATISILISVIISYIVLKVYDEPTRLWLTSLKNETIGNALNELGLAKAGVNQ